MIFDLVSRKDTTLKALMSIAFSFPGLNRKYSVFLVSTESPYFSDYKSEILPSNAFGDMTENVQFSGIPMFCLKFIG